MTTVDHQLNINGEERTVSAGTGETLLEVLREGLGLRGTKRGCNQGVCGACTVMIDGRAMRSCLLLAVGCVGQEIMTVEGLATDNQLSSLQQAVADAGAVQCGFCTPGMLISLQALFNETSNPSLEKIRQSLSGNLCRCTGYKKIVDAACAVAMRAGR